MLDLLSFRNAQRIKHGDHSVRTEQAHQIVLQRNIESGFTRITLTTASAAQLVVDTSGLMPLRTDDHKPSCGPGFLIQLDIRTTARHVGCDGNRPVDTGVGYDLGLHLVELRIEHLVFYAAPFQQAAQLFRSIDIDGAHQHRLSFGMRLLHRRHDGAQLLFPCLIYTVLMIDTRNRFIGRNRHHVHAVDIAKFLFFRQSRTGHTCFFLKFIKKVLERDGSQRLALPLHFHMFLGLDRLMQAVGITSARHDTARETVNDQHLIIFHHIILVAEHQIVSAQGQNNVVLNLQILRIRQIFNLEESLHPGHTLCGQVHYLILLIDDKVTRLLTFHTHDGIHLGQLFHVLAAGQLSGQNVAGLIQLRGLAALPGNDQRCAGFVDQDGIHLVDDGIVQIPEHQLFLVDDHIVAQVIEPQFIIGHISDITVIGFPTLLGFHVV